ncbi:HlyD family type I secretion periplasmic adaptor subunit [Trichloromonas sp.]|uniref:HlyD family type I secretion periplasmic adaptor subunit n=1 Tax=Trichloromonas sp. TaxID=3069249 RepID=UPI003D818ADE
MPSPDRRFGIPGWMRTILHHFTVFRAAWREDRKAEAPLLPQGREVEFLPAVLEIQHAPPSPIGRAVVWTIVLLFIAGVVWAGVGKIDIVAVARGRIVPGGYTKTIQPLESGIVTVIHVQNGQPVKKGDVLIELDPTVSGADRERIENDYRSAQVDLARLKALMLGREDLKSPNGVDPTYVALQQRLLRDQLREFNARIAAAERVVAQRRSAIKGIEADLSRLEQILPIITHRAESFRELYAQGHGSRLEADETERERIERVQELAAGMQRLAQEESALVEAQKTQEVIVAEFHKNTQAQLADLETRTQAMGQELVKAKHADQRQRLTAPVDGTVQQLAVHTIGGIVTPAQPLMVIVPDEDRLEVEAWVGNQDIGFVDAEQKAEIKVDAFPFTRYGIIDGEIVSLSKDSILIEEVGYVYAARVKMAKTNMQVEHGRTVNLSPGMDVAVEIKTGERRLIEFLLSPVLKAVGESGRER